MKMLFNTKVTGRFLLLSVIVVVFTGFLLTYCGGGGGYGGGGSTPVNTTYSVSGTITANGAGLPGVSLTLSGAASKVATSDASGNYSFSGLANGNYVITPSLTGYMFSPVSTAKTVSGANIASVDFTGTLSGASTFSISGTVTLNSAGLAGVTMTLTGANSGSVMSDSNGNYTLSGLVNGSYTVTPSRSGFTFTPVNSTQTVNGANITAVNFVATSVQLVQLVACPGSGTTPVSIVNMTTGFSPSSLTVPVNTIVQWTNNDAIQHTVTSTTVPANGAFDSSLINPGTSVCFKFTTAGTYNYHCSIHPLTMIGVVTVQ